MISIDPAIFTKGAFSIRWYGVMAALGLLAAYLTLHLRAKKYSFTSNNVSDSVFVLAVSGFIGARLLYVIRFWNEVFSKDFLEVFRIYNGGLVFLGGFALAAAAGVVLCRIRKWNIGDFTDFMAPALPLGHAFGRMGCLLNGCCHGFDYDGPMAFQYAHNSSPSFPLQGIGFIVNICMSALLLWLESKKMFGKRRFLIYLLMYCVARFVLEFGRGDYPPEQLFLGLTPAQITCVWLLPLTIIAWIVINRICSRKKSE